MSAERTKPRRLRRAADTESRGPSLLMDVFVALLMIGTFSSMNPAFLPKAPGTLLTVVALPVLLLARKHAGSAFKVVFALYLCAAILDVIVSHVFTNSPLVDVVITSQFCLAGVVAVYCRDARSFSRLAAIFYGVLLLSAVIYLATLVVPRAFSFYGVFFRPKETEFVVQPRGLARAAHLFGYQMSVLSVALVIELFRVGKKELRWLMLPAAVLSLGALFVQGSRSGVLGLLVVLVLVWWRTKTLSSLIVKPGTLAILGLLLTSGVAVTMKQSAMLEWMPRQGRTLLDRYDEESDTSARLDLQLVAVKTLIQHPAGLLVARQRWADIVNRDSRHYDASNAPAVHNAYLGYMLENGVGPGLLLIWLGAYGVMMAFRCLKWAAEAPGLSTFMITIPAGYLVDLVNSLLHNSSFVREPFCAMLFFLLVGEYTVLSRMRSQRPPSVLVRSRVRPTPAEGAPSAAATT